MYQISEIIDIWINGQNLQELEKGSKSQPSLGESESSLGGSQSSLGESQSSLGNQNHPDSPSRLISLVDNPQVSPSRSHSLLGSPQKSSSPTIQNNLSDGNTCDDAESPSKK
jgi:hypothetical protein